jgi:hypothetical protein
VYFRTKTIKGTPLVQLVESYRNAEGSPRQRVVASLGDADIPEAEKTLISASVTRHLHGADGGVSEDWFEPELSVDAAAWVARIVALAGRSKGGRQRVAAAVVDGVLLDEIETTDVVELGPELVAMEAWKALGFTSMLAELGMNPSRIATAQLLVSNRLIEPLSEWALIDRLTPADCADLKPVVVLDAGFASKANIELLCERGYSYLINITRGSRSKYAEFFQSEEFEALPGRKPALKVEVKKITDPDDAESQLVLCRSAQRRLKEEAMISKAESRFLADVELLRERIGKGRLKKTAIIERKIGTLQKKHPRVQRFYKIEHSGSTLEATRDDAKMEGALELCGDYVLKTDKDMEASELWGLYMTLLKAESGFRMLKGTLGLRPNFHQLEHRVDGHIFISVLAYHLLSWVRHHMDRAGDTREWKTLRRLLGTHSLVSTRLPLQDGRIVTVRKPSLPDAEQAKVYKILGIDWKQTCPAVKSEVKGGTIL